jgi:hypothetical protein
MAPYKMGDPNEPASDKAPVKPCSASIKTKAATRGTETASNAADDLESPGDANVLSGGAGDSVIIGWNDDRVGAPGEWTC